MLHDCLEFPGDECSFHEGLAEVEGFGCSFGHVLDRSEDLWHLRVKGRGGEAQD